MDSIRELRNKFAHPGNEAAIIACVLKEPTNYFEVEAKLADEDFLTPHHKAIWTIIKTLIREGITTVDAASILNHANVLKIDDQIGGYDYINALFEKSVDPANIDFYIERVLDASTKFKVCNTLEDISDLTSKNKTLTGETLKAKDIVDYCQEKFLQISIEGQRATEAENLTSGLNELIEEVLQSPVRVRGLETGFSLLDEAINGLEPGTLTVVGARPKVGKSAFLLNVARKIAPITPVLYIDTEMSGREQQFRLISLLSGIPERSIKNGTYAENPENAVAVEEAIKIAEQMIILHKYYPDFTAEGVSALARKYHYQFGIGCVIFDYIKLPDADLQLVGNVKEHQALGYLCVALKNLAGQLQIPVLTAAQIGRGGANKGHVTSSDFADSDRIFRYANTLLGLGVKTPDEYKKLEEEYGRDQALSMGTHRLQILDTRAGGTNFMGIDLYFRKKIITMREAQVQLSALRSVREGEEDEF